MDEQSFLAVLHAFGLKYYELEQGFAAMFNLCIRANVFTEAAFHQERLGILQDPGMQEFGAVLESLKIAKGQVTLEEALKKYKGPIQ